jgi:hypothetical protein
MSRSTKKQGSTLKNRKIRIATVKSKLQKLTGGYVPKELEQALSNIKSMREMIRNLGLHRGGIFRSKSQIIDDTKMVTDLTKLSGMLHELDDDDKYKLCEMMTYSLYAAGPDTPADKRDKQVMDGWGTEDLKKSATYKKFVDTMCFHMIREYQALQKAKEELTKRMSQKKMGASAKPDTGASAKPKQLSEYGIAHVTEYMDKKPNHDMEPATDNELIGLHVKLLKIILTKLAFDPVDIKNILVRISQFAEINELPSGTEYTYNMISNGTEIMILAVNPITNKRYCITNGVGFTLTSDTNGKSMIYNLDKDKYINPYKVSINIITKSTASEDEQNATNIATDNNTKRNSKGPRRTSSEKQRELQQVNKEHKQNNPTNPKTKRLTWKPETSNCTELDKEECNKDDKCKYDETSKKCITKRDRVDGYEYWYYPTSNVPGESNA